MIFRKSASRGVAAVEMAFASPVLIWMLVGIWEVGRMVQIQQVLNSATREGARLAAQGQIINSKGDPTQVTLESGTLTVKQQVVNYLNRGNLNLAASDVTVTFAFKTSPPPPPAIQPAVMPQTEPWHGVRNQQFQVTATIPITALRWSTLGIYNATQSTATVVWSCMVDDAFTLNEQIPNN